MMAIFENWEQLMTILAEYKGRIVGMLVGFLAAILVIAFGFISALFIMICMGLGYYVGQRYDNQQDIKEIINDVLPPQE